MSQLFHKFIPLQSQLKFVEKFVTTTCILSVVAEMMSCKLLQEHDSYVAFRSSGLNMKISLDAGVSAGFPDVISTPSCLMYNSTMRWFDKLKVWYQLYSICLFVNFT